MTINTKYDIGDKVYFVMNGQLNGWTITGITVKMEKNTNYLEKQKIKLKIVYKLNTTINNGEFREDELFTSKEEYFNSVTVKDHY